LPFARDGKPFEIAVDGTLVVNDVRLALRVARDGLGLLQLESSYAKPPIAEDELETVLDDWAPPRIDGFFLYYPSRRHMRAPLQAFVDFLRKEAKVKSRARRA
jgi:DNA-binding transcriptional LysR family regulator